MKIAEKFYEYGINVKIVDCKGFDDVGEMSKIEFLIFQKPLNFIFQRLHFCL